MTPFHALREHVLAQIAAEQEMPQHFQWPWQAETLLLPSFQQDQDISNEETFLIWSTEKRLADQREQRHPLVLALSRCFSWLCCGADCG